MQPKATGQSSEPGHNASAYAISSSIEVGYHFVDDRGSHDRFRSELNLRDGLRLLDYQFDARAINGRGALFDFLRGDVVNAGGDGSQYYSLRAEKARVYRFDGAVRQFNYYRFLPSFVNGQHGFDLDQQVSDFNLKLFPQRAVRFDLGYTRSRAKGPLTTTYAYDFDDFQVKAEERWEANDYRLGLETSYRRWNFLLGGMYRTYKSDWRYFQDAGVNRGAIPNDRVTLNSFDRFTADRAKAALVRWGAQGALTSRLHLAARGHYTDEWLEGALRESNSGVNNLNVPILAQSVSAAGEAKRSSATSDVALTYDLTEHITVSNTFDYNALRIPGDAQALIQTRTLRPGGNEQTTTAPTFNSRLTDLTSYWNTLQVNLSLGAKFSANLGWRATSRDIRLDILPNRQAQTTNNTQAFIGGARFRPVKPVSLFFDYERGTLDTAFVRLNPLEIQRTRVRANLQLSESFSINSTFSGADSANPTPQVNNEADFRSFSLSANWERGARLWLNGGYNYDTLSSVADLFFFSRFAPQRGRSAYFARQHTWFLDSRLGLTRRLDLMLVYRYLQDRGAPASTGLTTGPAGPNNFIFALPLHRHNPEARLAWRFSERVTGNLSYRHYSYNEKTFSVQDYRARIVTTSLRFTF